MHVCNTISVTMYNEVIIKIYILKGEDIASRYDELMSR